jgi:hypothetical protein
VAAVRLVDDQGHVVAAAICGDLGERDREAVVARARDVDRAYRRIGLECGFDVAGSMPKRPSSAGFASGRR